MNRRVLFAVLLALVCHGTLILLGRYRLSYDAYTHMFFADHYLHHWGTLWDPRWYTGFNVVSYPPLAHQVMALVALATGVDAAFGVVILAVLVALPVAVYAFARIFVNRDTAGFSALGAAVLPSTYLSAHVFGQLPTLTAAVFALLGLASLARFLRGGEKLPGVLTILLLTVTIATHHATLLFLPFGVLAAAGHGLIRREVSLPKLALRLGIVAFFTALAGGMVIWPFWWWGVAQTMQTPIDHLSRHNFLTDRSAFLTFFVPMYGLMIVMIPYAVWNLKRRAMFAPAAAFTLLFVLGLGGTTPLPRLLFGSAWEWLTYDRFSLWASLLLMIFFGKLAVKLQGILRLAWPHRFDAIGAWERVKRTVQLAAIPGLLLVSAIGAALFTLFVPTQPEPVDMQPIADFLNQADRAQWRYLTFGFGDQYALLSLLTPATTIDGSYHSARSLPELRMSGIGQIDTILWTDRGLGALDPILQVSGRYGVRWGFVNRAEYVPVLLRNGWTFEGRLGDGVSVWQNPHADKPTASIQASVDDTLQTFSWHVLPLTALALCAVLGIGYFRPVPVRRLLLFVNTLSLGVLPACLCFWYFRDLIAVDHDRIYFSYLHGLLYISDVVIVVAVIAWSVSRLLQAPSTPKRDESLVVRWLTRSLLAFCIWSTLSVAWADDRLVALIFATHLWLLFAFYYSLKDHPISWRVFIAGVSIALFSQIIIGAVEFASQSTALLAPLQMRWPGSIEPIVRGASVVQLADGTRWLRAYGSLPHPNILGGLACVCLAGAIAWFLRSGRLNGLALLTVFAGMSVIILTFSRAAVLGCILMGLVLLYHRRKYDRKKLLILVAVAILTVSGGLALFGRLMLTRVSDFTVITERISIEDRVWMTQQSLEMMSHHPILGVGIGNFVVELVKQVPGTFMVNPVHNLVLLSANELGMPGLVLVVAVIVILGVALVRAGDASAVLALLPITGLLMPASFDHFLWSLAPGRALLWLSLGVWAGWYCQRNKKAANVGSLHLALTDKPVAIPR